MLEHTQLLLNSYRSMLKQELLDRDGSAEEQARALFGLMSIVVSHGTESDPVFNYANQIAQDTFEMDWAAFTQTPSRFSAEPVERAERERLMSEVRSNGCIRNYRGIRISKTGRRFQIDDATVWNVHDSSGVLRGQAAALFKWHFI
jgi:hypothetical protein